MPWMIVYFSFPVFLVLRDTTRSRCENESETEDDDQHNRRQEEYLTNYDHVKYKISKDLISGYQQARQA